MVDLELYQCSIFDELFEKKVITKKIRLIELFSGIGAQAKALEILNIPFEHYLTCEWAYNSIVGYNAIHIKDKTDYAKDMSKEQLLSYLNGNISIDYNKPADLTKKPIEWLKNCYNNVIATHDLMNIMNVKGRDLGVFDKDYEYILTYSFPCQDLSLAGKRSGMETSQSEGGTRSGLLWEVERILLERKRENLDLPGVLLMENVPEVVGTKNDNHFYKWCNQLSKLGYQNYFKILNAKNYGIPQNRKRCFMISILGDYTYDFPKKLTLKHKLKDLLDKNVDEKYYLSQQHIEQIQSWGGYENPLKDIEKEKSIIGTLTTHCGKESNGMKLVSEGEYIPIKNATKQGYLLAEEGDGLDISGRMKTHRGTVQKETCQTLTTGGDNVGVVVKEEQTLKQELCNKLIEYGLVKEGDIVKHSFTGQIMSGNRKCVEKSDEMITLTTRGDCVGVCVDAYSESERKLFTEDGNIKRHLGSDIIDKFEEGQMVTTTFPNGYGHGSRVHNESITLNTVDRSSVKQNLRIRKLTPCECIKLMGFERKDYESLVEYGLSDSAIYHCAGDSIVTTSLIGLFGTMTNKDYEQIIKDYVERIAND